MVSIPLQGLVSFGGLFAEPAGIALIRAYAPPCAAVQTACGAVVRAAFFRAFHAFRDLQRTLCRLAESRLFAPMRRHAPFAGQNQFRAAGLMPGVLRRIPQTAHSITGFALSVNAFHQNRRASHLNAPLCEALPESFMGFARPLTGGLVHSPSGSL